MYLYDKSKLKSNYTIWRWINNKEFKSLITKPEINDQVGKSEIIPTIEKYNKFSGLLASGRIKPVGINSLFQSKTDSTKKYYVVGFPPLIINNGEFQSLLDVGAGFNEPNFTVFLKGSDALTYLEESV